VAERAELRELASFYEDPDVPAPMRAFARLFFWTLGTVGWMGVLAVQATFVPIVYALVTAFMNKREQPRIEEVRRKVDAGLGSARREMRALTHASKRRPRQLPPRR
jgi:hypothetical protein